MYPATVARHEIAEVIAIVYGCCFGTESPTLEDCLFSQMLAVSAGRCVWEV